MSNKSCFFIGNKHTPNTIKEQLVNIVEKHIVEYGVTTFTVGNYGNFDKIAQGVLREVKEWHPNISLYLLAPYALNQKVDILKGFDGTFYPDGLEKVPFRLAIVQANRYMVEHNDYLISYCHYIGNTRKIVEYAQKREKRGLIKVTLL